MISKKRIIGGILCLALLVSLVVPVHVQGADTVISEGAFDYRLTANGAEVFKFYPSGSSVVSVPAYVQGHPVTAIGTKAFYNVTGVSKITLPEGLQTIGEKAFYACADLAQIVLPSTLKEIGEMAFSNCYGLETLKIPKNVQTIGLSAFLNCTAMRDLQVATGNAWFKAVDSVLFSADMTELIAYPNAKAANAYTIPAQVTRIADKAFLECAALQNVVFPVGLKEIGKYAFSACSALAEAKLPGGVEKIGAFAFNNCAALCKVQLGERLEDVPNYAFNGCESLESIRIPDSVKTIGQSVFSGCDSLTDVVLGASVTTIGAGAFNCGTLKSFVLPETVTRIGSQGLGKPEQVFFRGTQAQKDAIALEESDFADTDWHYGVENKVFGGKNCYYCASCDECLLLDGSAVLATVTFLGWGGKVITKAQYHYGDTVAIPQTPDAPAAYTFVGWDKEIVPCTNDATYKAVFVAEFIPGDANGDSKVDHADVIWLLWHRLFDDSYPLGCEGDLNQDGIADNDDVMYLLWHLVFGDEQYPLV